MLNRPVTTIDQVKHAIQNSYSEQDWLLVVLKHNGWADSYLKLNPLTEAGVGIVRINDVNIIARRELVELPTPTLSKVKITVDFRVPGYDGWYHTVASLKYPTEEDIRWTLVKLKEYTGLDLAVPISS
jgi:hypothetical protein